MPITSMQRNIEGSPNTVYIETTDSLLEITAPRYLILQQDFIRALNNGDFTFLPTDYCLISYSDGESFFQVDFTNSTFVVAQLAQNVLQYSTATITAAQFNGMYAAPKLLVAAPGANKLIVLERMSLVMTYGAAAFAAGGVVLAQYDSTVHGAGSPASNTEAAADFFASASTTFSFNGNSGNTAGAVPFSTSINKGLYLSNQTGAFTTGDSNFVAQVWYKIVSTV